MFTKKAYALLIIMLFLLQSGAVYAEESVKKIFDNKDSLETTYKNVVDELVNVGKAHPVSQPKVYAVLDQLDQIHATAKYTLEQEAVLRETVKKKEAEIAALQQDMLLMKTDHDGVQQKLSAMSKKLEAEKKQSKLVAEEKKKLEKQVEKQASTLQAMNTTAPAVDQALLDKAEKSEKVVEKPEKIVDEEK